MFKKYSIKYYKRIILLIFISLALQISFNDYNLNSLEDKDFEFITPIYIEDYLISGSTYTSLSDDPRLYFNIESNGGFIKIKMNREVERDIEIQAYYRIDGSYNQEFSSQKILTKDSKEVKFHVPDYNFDEIRIDIGTTKNLQFDLAAISYADEEFTIVDLIRLKTNVFSTIAILSVLFLFIQLYLSRKKLLQNFNEFDKRFLIIMLFIFILWSIILPFNASPDERMRFDVIQYMHHYKTLPTGLELELLDPLWGVSYAMTPYLSGIFSAFFMELVSLFSVNENLLFFVARITNILIGVGTVYFIIKISYKVFKDEYRKLFIFSVCLWPLFVFLGTYLNNDMISLLTTTMIIYYLICGIKDDWSQNSIVGLSIANGLCLLSYYNAYPFVLGSVVIFIIDNVTKKTKKEVLIRKFGNLMFYMLIIAAWWFVRNIIIYDGDILGLSVSKEYSNLYAIDKLKFNTRATPNNQGFSLIYMLFTRGWIRVSASSFVGVFGYLDIWLSKHVYNIYLGFVITGLLGHIFNLSNRKLFCNLILKLGLLSISVLVIILSIYNSFMNDYQPQGRYIVTILIPLIMLVISGIANILDSRFFTAKKNTVISLLEKAIIVIFSYVFITNVVAVYLDII